MIYLDNSATTKPDKEVLDAFMKVNSDYWSNPASIHNFGGQAEVLLNRARLQIADLLGVKGEEIIFTSGATESNNTAIKGVASRFSGRGKHIIASSIEHSSVHESFEQLAAQGFDVTFLPVDADGRVQVETVKAAMREDTILVSVMQVNNEIGTIQPIEAIGAIVEQYPKAFFHVDGTQGFSKVPLSLRAAHVDLYSLSTHKFHGLKGTGILFVRDGIRLDALLAGGNQERNIRSGTVNVAGAVSIAKAMRLAMEKSRAQLPKLVKLQSFLYDELVKLPQVVMNTPKDGRAPHIINFSIPSINTEVFVRDLEKQEIYISTTSACSSKKRSLSKVILALGKSEDVAASTARVSFCFDTTEEEVITALDAIKRSIQMLEEV